MKPAQFQLLAILILVSTIMLFAGMYLLAKFNQLFKRSIKNELLRKNFVVCMTALCFITSLAPTTPNFYGAFYENKLLIFYTFEWFVAILASVFVFNVSWIVIKYLDRTNLSFRKRMGVILFIIITCSMLVGVPTNYLGNKYLGEGASFKSLHVSLLFNFYMGCIIGLVYITMSYVDLERKRKLDEKELEVARLQQLKAKAELDALHSKINPHFLYNALNSIADLAITDGKKARKMTIALADLFRYSINSSDHNYSTLKEEVEMTRVYLEIEKIRFEDQLNYSIHLD